MRSCTRARVCACVHVCARGGDAVGLWMYVPQDRGGYAVGRASTGHIRLRLPFEARAALALRRGRLAHSHAPANGSAAPHARAAYGLHTQAYTPPPPDPAVVHANFFAGAARGFERH